VERGCGVNSSKVASQGSPDYFKVIELYLLVGGYERNLPLHRLRDDYAIKWIAMVEWKGFRTKNVLKANWQKRHIQRRYLGKQSPD
jgi:hypothetical protein